MSGWLDERKRNGGIDEVPFPAGTSGRVWLCGKHLIGPDVEAAMARVGATTVVCLNEAYELHGRYDDYVGWLRSDERAVWFPIHDMHAPAAAGGLLDDLARRLEAGERLIVHCGAGMGRAGTVAAALLIRAGVAVDDALAIVASARPGAGPQATDQLHFLRGME